MAQIFVFGASTAYGVGGEDGGLGDMLKTKLHALMYGQGGVGEKHELYNFTAPGATIEFVLGTFDSQIEQYKKKTKLIAIVLVGGNNARAKDAPDNFVSTVSEYKAAMKKLLTALKNKVNHTICIGLTGVDETKTTPKQNSLSGGQSYFWNKRLIQFSGALEELCREMKTTFIKIDVDQDEWKKIYLWNAGLPPNKDGHRLIFDILWPEVEKLL